MNNPRTDRHTESIPLCNRDVHNMEDEPIIFRKCVFSFQSEAIGSKSVTYSQLKENVLKVAAGLHKAGFRSETSLYLSVYHFIVSTY